MSPDPRMRRGLPFPTRPLKVQGGVIPEYIIPDEYKEAVLKLMYPFIPVPSLEDEMIDLHEDKTFKVKEFKVVHDFGMDMLVSPYYPVSGGSVIDWVNEDMAVEFDEDDWESVK
jgi:hypothetical protein